MSDTPEDSPLPRAGTQADIARRLDRLENRQDIQAADLRALVGVVARVEQNQEHAAKLADIRFSSLDAATTSVKGTLDVFILRMNSLISGETQTTQGRDMMEDYKAWRAAVDEDREEGQIFHGQIKVLGRLLAIVVGGNALAIIGAIAYLATAVPR